MKVYIENDILYINKESLPPYKKGGSLVRNNFFWALKSISCYSPKNKDWEFDQPVWKALNRMLLFFTNSGYLGYSETILEFDFNVQIPDDLRSSSTFI